MSTSLLFNRHSTCVAKFLWDSVQPRERNTSNDREKEGAGTKKTAQIHNIEPGSL